MTRDPEFQARAQAQQDAAETLARLCRHHAGDILTHWDLRNMLYKQACNWYPVNSLERAELDAAMAVFKNAREEP